MNELKVLFLAREDVVAAGGADVGKSIGVIEDVFRVHASKDYCQPLKPYLRIPGDEERRRIIAMPAYLGGSFKVWGVKWIASNPTNPFKRNVERASAVVILNDVETGFPISIMEGAVISATRTGAVGAVAAKYLAPADSSVLGVVGAGVIARSIIRGVHFVQGSIEKVKVYDLEPSRAASLGREIEGELGLEVAVVNKAEAAVRDADIVVPATTATAPYIEGEWVKQGGLFLNISLRDPKFSVVQSASKIVVDDWFQANRENTVLSLMYEQGLLKDSDIYAELGEIVTGSKRGRENSEEMIFFNPMGMAIEDLGIAQRVYERAKQSGLGTYIDL